MEADQTNRDGGPASPSDPFALPDLSPRPMDDVADVPADVVVAPSEFDITLDLASYDHVGDPSNALFGSPDGDASGLTDDLFDEVSPDDPTNLHFGFGPG